MSQSALAWTQDALVNHTDSVHQAYGSIFSLLAAARAPMPRRTLRLRHSRAQIILTSPAQLVHMNS